MMQLWHPTPLLQLDCGALPQRVQRLYWHGRAFAEPVKTCAWVAPPCTTGILTLHGCDSPPSDHALIRMTHISRVTFLAGIDNLPETASPESLDDDDFLAAFHHALLEVSTRDSH